MIMNNLWILVRDLCILPIRLLGKSFVILHDSDGSEHVRMIRTYNGYYGAWRVGLGIRFVKCFDNGLIKDGGYVVCWSPYIPFKFNKQPEMENNFPKWGDKEI